MQKLTLTGQPGEQISRLRWLYWLSTKKRVLSCLFIFHIAWNYKYKANEVFYQVYTNTILFHCDTDVNEVSKETWMLSLWLRRNSILSPKSDGEWVYIFIGISTDFESQLAIAPWNILGYLLMYFPWEELPFLFKHVCKYLVLTFKKSPPKLLCKNV